MLARRERARDRCDNDGDELEPEGDGDRCFHGTGGGGDEPCEQRFRDCDDVQRQAPSLVGVRRFRDGALRPSQYDRRDAGVVQEYRNTCARLGAPSFSCTQNQQLQYGADTVQFPVLTTESCPSGRRSTIGNRVGVKSVSRVQIPDSPPVAYSAARLSGAPIHPTRRGGRVVECGGLENRLPGVPGYEGSNPSSSARWYTSPVPLGSRVFAVERRDCEPARARSGASGVSRWPRGAAARRSRADIPPPPSSSAFHSCALSVHFRALVLSGMGNGAHALEANLQVFAWCHIGFRKPQDWCQTKPRVVSERRVMLWLHGRGQERHRSHARNDARAARASWR